MSFIWCSLLVAGSPQPPGAGDGSTPGACSRSKAALVKRSADVPARIVDLELDLTDVLHYRLELDVDTAVRRLRGVTTMTVTSRSDGLATFRFWLHRNYEITSIEVVFHEDVVVDAGHFELRDVFDRAIDVSLTYDPDSFTATLEPVGLLVPGRYTLTIHDGVVDAAGGIALDGEIADTHLPSGDGLPGGDAEIRFTVDGNRYRLGRRLPTR